MRYIYLIAFLSFYSSNLKAQGFREFKWGADVTQIIQKEGQPDITQGKSITYTNKYLLRHKTFVSYFTLPGKGLAHGMYYMDYDETSYKEIEQNLRRKYGMPMMALDFRSSIWDVGDTEIILVDDEKGEKILIKYYKKAWMKEFIQYVEKQVLKDL